MFNKFLIKFFNGTSIDISVLFIPINLLWSQLCRSDVILDAISFLLEPVYVACHSQNTSSVDSNIIHLRVF